MTRGRNVLLGLEASFVCPGLLSYSSPRILLTWLCDPSPKGDPSKPTQRWGSTGARDHKHDLNSNLFDRVALGKFNFKVEQRGTSRTSLSWISKAVAVMEVNQGPSANTRKILMPKAQITVNQGRTFQMQSVNDVAFFQCVSDLLPHWKIHTLLLSKSGNACSSWWIFSSVWFHDKQY